MDLSDAGKEAGPQNTCAEGDQRGDIYVGSLGGGTVGGMTTINTLTRDRRGVGTGGEGWFVCQCMWLLRVGGSGRESENRTRHLSLFTRRLRLTWHGGTAACQVAVAEGD